MQASPFIFFFHFLISLARVCAATSLSHDIIKDIHNSRKSINSPEEKNQTTEIYVYKQHIIRITFFSSLDGHWARISELLWKLCAFPWTAQWRIQQCRKSTFNPPQIMINCLSVDHFFRLFSRFALSITFVIGRIRDSVLYFIEYRILFEH